MFTFHLVLPSANVAIPVLQLGTQAQVAHGAIDELLALAGQFLCESLTIVWSYLSP